MKRIAAVLVAFGMMFAGGVALAHGNGSDHHAGPDTAALKNFQKETFAVRDELATKRLDLQAEYQKTEPDKGRIAALRKEIGDLEAKIQIAGDKYGVHSSGRGHEHDMMAWDDGCGCGHCW